MLLSHNPTQEIINELIRKSEMKAAKWLRDTDTGEMWYWPADWTFHMIWQLNYISRIMTNE